MTTPPGPHGPAPAFRGVARELLVTFLTGALFLTALALLRDHVRNAQLEGPASTVYGDF